MYWQLNPYALILSLSAFMSILVAVQAWHRRTAPGAYPLVFVSLGAAEWALGYAVATGFQNLAMRVFLAKIQYLGIVSLPTSVLILVLEYTGREKWLRRRNIYLLGIVPIATLLLAWTNELHHLIWADLQVSAHGSLYKLDVVYGPFFWLHAVYSYLLLLCAVLLLLRMIFFASRLQRLQSLTILAGALLPWVGNFLYLTGWNPLPQLDLTPFGYSLSGLVLMWGLFRYQLLDMVPIARDRIVERMSDGVLILDPQDRIVDLNPAMRRIAALSSEEAVVGLPAGDVLSHWPALVSCLRSGEAAAEVAWDSDGGLRYYDLRISTFMNRRDRLAARLVVLHDVTQRRQAEHDLRRYANRMETMREIDQSILAARSAETIAVAVAGRVRYLVPCQRVIVVEVTEEQQLEKLAAESSGQIDLDVDVAIFSELLADESIRQGWVRGVEDLEQIADRSPMQQALYAQGVRAYVVVPLFIQDELIGMIHLESTQAGIFTAAHVNAAIEIAVLLAIGIRQTRLYERAQREIAERKQAQAALHRRTLQLEAQNAELDAFAHTVAHDLKNPLSTIMGYASFLIDLYEDPTVTREESSLIAEQIVLGGEVMDRIIESLLLLSGVRKQQVDLAPLDMGRILDEVQRSLAGLIEEHEAEIFFPRPGTWPTAWGYGPWVGEVWLNYLSNAIKYGGSPPTVAMGAVAQENGFVRFWVRDNGFGLSPEEQARLFTPFERLSDVQMEGHGLGLSIVRRIVEKLGGEVGVESEVGRGSEFWFSLKSSQE